MNVPKIRIGIIIMILITMCSLTVSADTLQDAKAAYNSGKLSKAYKLITQLLTEEDGRKEVYLYAGIIYSDLGKHEKSIEILYQGLQRFPEDHDLLLIVGRNQIRQGRYLEAFELMKRLISKGNKSSKVREYAGDAAVGLGRYKDAIYYYQRALKINPNEVWIYIKMGRLQKRLGEYKEAHASFKNAYSIADKKNLRLLKQIAVYELKHIPGQFK